MDLMEVVSSDIHIGRLLSVIERIQNTRDPRMVLHRQFRTFVGLEKLPERFTAESSDHTNP